MRRSMLLLVGLGGCLTLLLTLGFKVAAQYPKLAEAREAASDTVAGTQIKVLDLVSYEGAFWEDGSDRPVVDIAAILLENPSDRFVTRGAVVLDWGEDRFVFEFSWLPPHSRTLVLESDAKPYRMLSQYECYGWTESEAVENSPVTVSADGMLMHLTNPTDRTLPQVAVLYKHYHPDSQTYIGGITYSAIARELRPGEIRTICPHHFSSLGSAILPISPMP